jgi:hypothetical protein
MPSILRLTPEACADIADRGADVAVALGRLGLHVGASRGLGLAIVHLRRAATERSLGADSVAWGQTAAAVQLVAAWVEVMTTLPSDPLGVFGADFISELHAALRGTSLDDPSTDVLSQLALGALVRQTGDISIHVPPGTGSRPDFVVGSYGEELGLEVKRPNREGAAKNLIRKAAGQLRACGCPGLVALDLSLVVGAHELTRESFANPTPVSDRLRSQFHTIGSPLANWVADRQEQERAEGRHAPDYRSIAPTAVPDAADPPPARFGCVLGLLGYVRVFEWGPNVNPTPTFMFTFGTWTFPHAGTPSQRAGLAHLFARLKQSTIARGPAPARVRQWSMDATTP